MTSVNKIKELAEAHEYELAVGILDSQNLEKSLNPQFLRVCGEIYENVGRLKEARYYYVKAHSMAPEATRIIYSLINYYLKVGYFDLAERYFEEYVFYSSGAERELINIKYVMKKAKKPDLEKLMVYNSRLVLSGILIEKKRLVENEVKNFPGDKFFIANIPDPESTNEGFVVNLRRIKEIKRDDISVRYFGSIPSCFVLGKLNSPYKEKLAQALGCMFSDLGLSVDYENERNNIISKISGDYVK